MDSHLSSGRLELEFQRRLAMYPGALQCVSVDTGSGREVIVAIVRNEQAAILRRTIGIRGMHLAGILEVHPSSGMHIAPGLTASAGESIVVAELVAGPTLRALMHRGPIEPFKAVAWLSRLVRAIVALHDAGAVHGAISPHSVVAEPVGRRVAPVLSRLVAPPLGAYASPERLAGAGPSASDDVWALCATLQAALTGNPPFAGDHLRPLEEFGLSEPGLQKLLDRGLSPDPVRRLTHLEELGRSLERWELGQEVVAVPRPGGPRPGGLSRIVAGGIRARGVPAATDPIVQNESTVSDCTLADAAPALAETPPPTMAPLVVRPAVSPERVVRPAPVGESSGGAEDLPRQELESSPTHVLGPARNAAVASAGREVLHLPVPASAAQASEVQASEVQASEVQAAPSDSAAASVPTSSSGPERSRRRRGRGAVRWVLLGMGLAGLVGGLAVFVFLPEAGIPMEPSTAVLADTPALDQPAARAPEVSPEQKRDACVRDYFPVQAFPEGVPTFGFLCEKGDLRVVSERLYSSARGAEEGVLLQEDPSRQQGGLHVRGARRSWLELRWFEIPATAIIQRSCCEQPPAVELPETDGWCNQLRPIVEDLVDASTKPVDLASRARKFDDAVTCLFTTATERPYEYQEPPSNEDREAFQKFLGLAAEADAKRAR